MYMQDKQDVFWMYFQIPDQLKHQAISIHNAD